MEVNIIWLVLFVCVGSTFGKFLATDCQYTDPATGKTFDLKPFISR
jgi:hypothetical protein